MNKVEEIFKSWRIALTVEKDDPKYELASKRIEICEGCKHKETIAINDFDIFTRCNVCGCALKGKIFTPKFFSDEGGSCPKEYWKNAEIQWLEKYSQK